jgi:hypothetical protein
MGQHFSQYTNRRGEDRKAGVLAAHDGKKDGRFKKDILPVGRKSEEVAGLKKRHHKMF